MSGKRRGIAKADAQRIVRRAVRTYSRELKPYPGSEPTSETYEQVGEPIFAVVRGGILTHPEERHTIPLDWRGAALDGQTVVVVPVRRVSGGVT